MIGVIGKITSEALTRAGGAPLIAGNRVRLLKDATENYPAWFSAIEAARQWIHFESYIIHDDPIGAVRGSLSAKARDGLSPPDLRLDWIPRKYAPPFLAADDPGWSRGPAIQSADCRQSARLAQPGDHRKMIAVDGRLAFL